MASEVELREAAERRLAWRKCLGFPAGCDSEDNPYRGDGGIGRQRIEDCMNLADAFLAARPLTDADKAAVERLKLKALAEHDPYAKVVMVSIDDLKRLLAMVAERAGG